MSPVLFAILAVTAVPPQPGAPGKLDAIVLDAITACARRSDGEIVVCARRRGPAPEERYRIPKDIREKGWDPRGSVDSVSRERHRLMEGGESGTGSCSAGGAGGWTGCLLQSWKHADQQNAGR